MKTAFSLRGAFSLFSLLILTSSLSLAAPNSEAVKLALESSSSCSNFVRYDAQNIYLGFGYYRRQFEEPRHPIPASLRVISIAHPSQTFTLATADAAIDSVRDGNSLFILTYSGIEEWNLTSHTRIAIYPTYNFSGTMAYKQHAQGFARFGDTLIIAHGRLGVSFFDLKTKRIFKQMPLIQSQHPLESMATGVTMNGHYAIIAMDNFSLVSNGKPAFRGLVVIDMNQLAVMAALGGMDPGADAVATDGKKLIVSFGGMPIWKYALNTFHGGSVLPEPENRIWRFPVKGHPTGSATMDDKYYYTCFYKEPSKPGGVYKKIPLALDRGLFNLN